jgi:hypothetical protein
MKPILLLCIFFVTVKCQAQAADTLHTGVLESYYHVKSALASGDASLASVEADRLMKKFNGIDYKVISEGNIKVLVKITGRIANSTNIADQRKDFENLSENMILVARSVRLSANPVYIVYCPMKKASWLNDTEQITNPYYGQSMLTCGEVKERL